jgi:hypothetical protein
MTRIRRLVLSGATTLVNGKKSVLTQQIKAQISYNFWHHFFDVNCQRPSDHVRLFPTNKSFRFIYDKFFLSWFGKQYPPEDSDEEDCVNDDVPTVPSISTFHRARWHNDFRDVAVRAKHYHCRCFTCGNLMARRLKGFLNEEQEASWELLFKAHEADARGWREVEERTKARARAEPQKIIYLGFDDTSVFGVPKLTNRTLKNLGTTRFDIIPFNLTNHSTNENVYIYTVKLGWQKGANRLCSVLYHYLRKTKFGGGVCATAEILIIHADNFSENKNNDLFLFLCELIYRRWFNEIRLEFGPVGHTHNKNDAVHFIHNQVAGNQNSFTLGEFQTHWSSCWRNENNIPVAVVAEVQYNFKKRYQQDSDNVRLAGFTNTSQDNVSVSAFKFGWSDHKESVVDVKWKKSASDQNWRGEDQKELSAGFVLMPFPPTDKPDLIEPLRQAIPKKYIGDLLGTKMQSVVKAHVPADEVNGVMDWLKYCATEGKMPYELVEDEVASEQDRRAVWGPKIKIGVGSKKGDFFLLTQDDELKTPQDFWALPATTSEQLSSEQRSAQMVQDEIMNLPDVRYQGVPRRSVVPRSNTNEPRHLGVHNQIENNIDVNDVQLLVSQPAEPSEAVPQRPLFGADWTKCAVGHFAVVDVVFKDKRGIEVVKITEIVSVDQQEEFAEFKGTQYVLNSSTLDQANRGCLKGNWYNPVNRSADTADSDRIFKSWWVLAYTDKLTQAGKLPAPVVKTITDKIAAQSIGTFEVIDNGLEDEGEQLLDVGEEDEGDKHNEDTDNQDSSEEEYVSPARNNAARKRTKKTSSGRF